MVVICYAGVMNRHFRYSNYHIFKLFHANLPDACLPVGRVGRAGRAAKTQSETAKSPNQQMVSPPVSKSLHRFVAPSLFHLFALPVISAGAANSGRKIRVVSFSNKILPLRGIHQVCHFIIREQRAGFATEFNATTDA